MSGPSAIFRLSGGHGLWITVSLGLPADSPLAADIVFRYLQRLCQALAERLERFQSSASNDETETRVASGPVRRGRRARRRTTAWASLAALFARLVARSTPQRAADVKPVSSSRAAAEALASPPPDARMITTSERRRPWTESRPIKETLPHPARAGPDRPGAPPAVNPAAVKTTSNYLKALKRRFWVVLAVAVPLAITTSILVLRLPPVYVVRAEIEINPPEN